MKLSESIDIKGTPTCSEQVISAVVSDDVVSSNLWSAERNNANNSWYVNSNNGNLNNNNVYNRYAVVPSLELLEYADLLFLAEENCWRNKHSSADAVGYHYHIGRIVELAKAIRDGYKPMTSICFVLSYPVYREVFAANYRDRIVHHLVAGEISRVAETVHLRNGNVSHGNRNRYSAHTAAKQILGNFDKQRNGWVMKLDVQGFFMSIDKDVAWSVFCEYAGWFRYKELIRTLLFHNPTSDCERRSPMSAWDNVDDTKSLFKSEGKGLPIGNYYSQLMANLLLAKVDELDLGNVSITRFVDDICLVADSVEELHEARKRISNRLNELQLKIHPRKLYVQPIRHGVNFCGRTIKLNRIYISNRTIRACGRVIRNAMCTPSLENARLLERSINSYFGLMSHCASYNRQKDMMRVIMESDYKKWLYFEKKRTQLVCRVKNRYREMNTSMNMINKLNNEIRQGNKWNDRNYRSRRRSDRCCYE